MTIQHSPTESYSMNPVEKHLNTLFRPLSKINNVLHMSDRTKVLV